ncbi:MAG: S46 family peptidase [Calditrichaceae bacterium]|nr:S46 family peptidase [Calditrichaceae bacterium]RQV94144.1 MAG: S46 family peptidase [Calditrichota bacterium]
MKWIRFILIALVFISGRTGLLAEEGMYPLTELDKLDLRKMGFELEAADIFSEGQTSLSDAVVKLGGCTGAFISAEGLILTNHHCSYGAVQKASNEENDYLKNGFIAQSAEEEVEAKGFTVRIVDSYKDVSQEVLSALHDTMSFQQKKQAIQKKEKEIIKRTEEENPGKRAEVSEMFRGEKYMLFIYTYIKDVRLVYVPPVALGEFGGDVDNWEWPRHTADFSLLRAYVAPDGSPADYAQDNVPFTPKKFLKVNPDGVEEEDFVFILGYPGRTYRHYTASYLDYEQNYRMPFIVDWDQKQISVMQEMSQMNRDVALKHSARIKGLANTEKNYRGKLTGLHRLNLVEKKRAQEKEIGKFIDNDDQLQKQYGQVLDDINKIYNEIKCAMEQELILSYLTRNIVLLNVAKSVVTSAEERQKEDLERQSAYMDRNFEQTKKSALRSVGDYYEPTDKILLKELISKANQRPADLKIEALDKIFRLKTNESPSEKYIDEAFSGTQLADKDFVEKAFNITPEEIAELNDPLINWYIKLKPEYEKIKKINEERNGALDALYAKWNEVKKLYLKKDFIPDANGTFRMTYGHIRGYSPRDAVYCLPITTLQGVVEKTTGQEPFNTPQNVIDLFYKKDFGRFKSANLDCIPVCLLYDMDTTGGNSGSPVLNARGELIGLNFDRTFEATINDYAWSETYSRSIGVDIRYILWIIEKVGGADHLIKEMEI